jgi:hypothetical protein
MDKGFDLATIIKLTDLTPADIENVPNENLDDNN